ncbi:MAG TPA: DUF1491 family protein [Azospirillaceae bacterium]|nr:DUF1491 family protein [Azospirillaceae bacterium]
MERLGGYPADAHHAIGFNMAGIWVMDEDGRLPTDLWVRLHVRRCLVDGIPAVIARKGAPSGGTVLLKVNQLEKGVRVLSQVRDLDGKLAWMAALGGGLVPEADADAYIARAVQRDPDIWVVEVEDRQGRHPFEGKVIG